MTRSGVDVTPAPLGVGLGCKTQVWLSGPLGRSAGPRISARSGKVRLPTFKGQVRVAYRPAVVATQRLREPTFSARLLIQRTAMGHFVEQIRALRVSFVEQREPTFSGLSVEQMRPLWLER